VFYAGSYAFGAVIVHTRLPVVEAAIIDAIKVLLLPPAEVFFV
jgi:hypothetical protein